MQSFNFHKYTQKEWIRLISIPLVILVLVLLSFYAGYNISRYESKHSSKSIDISMKMTSTPTISLVATSSVSPTPTTEIIKVDANFNKYVDNKLGISIKYPIKSSGNNTCIKNKDDLYDTPKNVNVSTGYFVDYTKNVVYLAQLQFVLTGNGKSNADGTFKGYELCSVYSTTLDILENGVSSLVDKTHLSYPPNYKFYIKSITSDADLNSLANSAFITNKTGCYVDKKALLTNSTDEYSVSFKGEKPTESVFDSTCPLNFSYKVLYSTKNEKAVAWALGQSVTWELVDSKGNFGDVFDQDITAEFLNKN